jgi:hypothetical protein
MRDFINAFSGRVLVHSFVKELMVGLVIAGFLAMLHTCRRALREAKRTETNSREGGP